MPYQLAAAGHPSFGEYGFDMVLSGIDGNMERECKLFSGHTPDERVKDLLLAFAQFASFGHQS